MRFALIVLAVFSIMNMAFAYQTLLNSGLLDSGYFLYNNITVMPGYSVVLGVNTTAPIDLVAIRSSDYNSYINSRPVSPVYNNTVTSGVYKLDLGSGNYTIISYAVQPTTLSLGIVVAPSNLGRMINLYGGYDYNLSLANYSNVTISLVSSANYANNPLSVNISGISTVLNSDANTLLPLQLNKGDYDLIFKAPKKMQLFVLLNVTPELVNPLAEIVPGGNYSAGVVSYGLYNVSGRLYPYQVQTDEIVGVANITSLSSYETNPPINASPYGSSLQLNVGLNTYINNKLRVFWMQDVVDFNTSSNEYYLVDNIWNNTNPSANLTTQALVGGGNLSVCSSCGDQTFYVDSYPIYYLNYSFPFRIKLAVLENQTPGGTRVDFGYQVLRNGTSEVGPLVFFDNVLIPGSTNSTFLTTPYYQTPGGGDSFGNYYDTELVFGGESNGANAYYQSLNSSLWLYYNKNGTLVPFPSLYTFGLSTAESASGVAVENWSDGALVTPGAPNLTEDLFAGNALKSIAGYISSSSNYTVPAATTVAQSGNPFQVNSISQTEIDTFELVAGIAILFILIVGFLLLRRH